MEFGEQEGKESCFRKEAQGAGDLGFSDGIRGGGVVQVR